MVFLGPRRPNMLALIPQPVGPIKFLSAAFDFLPVCVIKCSCAALVEHNCESLFTNIRISHQRPTCSTTSTTSGQTDTKNGQMGPRSGQASTMSGRASTISG